MASEDVSKELLVEHGISSKPVIYRGSEDFKGQRRGETFC